MLERTYNNTVLALGIPDRIRRLPISAAGWPVPWFVAQVDGEWDFRVVGPGKISEAVKRHLCWVCGEKMGVHKAFPIGPMCAINRTISEPPSHLSCAEYSVRVCPFLANPRTRRNEKDVPAEAKEAAGIAIKRNPGVICIWVTRSYNVVRVGDGLLFRLGPPEATSWWCEGRQASRHEVQLSIDGGLPLLRKVAEDEGPEAVREFERYVDRVAPLLPKD